MKRYLMDVVEIEKENNLIDRIYPGNLKERKIILNCGVDSYLYETVAMQIEKFNEKDKDLSIEERKPIRIFINSYSGIVYDGSGIVSAIERSKTPVYTITDDYVMSMGLGLAIFIAGHKRFCGKYANFMYHELSTIAIGKNQEIERVSQENRRLQKMYDELITSRTHIKQSKLNSIKKKGLDWFFGAEEALELGVVHEII